jgi:TPR repeat protein
MQTLPEGHPAISSPSAGGGAAGERTLKPAGIGSQAELDKVAAPLKDPAVRARFEDGFRRCFTSDQASRDYMGAAEAMNEILAKVPDFAPAYRVLAYAKLNTGDMQASTDLYRKAVAADPNYGEAQYALAFMLTQIDPVEGRKHFEKAMQLGVPDERDLRTKFYPPGS